MGEPPRIICVDDEPGILKSLERLFLDDDYELYTATTVEEGLAILEEKAPVQLVISDYRMPGVTGVDFLRQVCERWPDTVRVVLSGYADAVAIVEAINLGHIYKFIPKPWNDDELRTTVGNCLERYDLTLRNRRLSEELAWKNAELTEMNDRLERIIAERTEELRASEERYRTVVECAPVGISTATFDGGVICCNRAVEELTGYSEAELQALRLADLYVDPAERTRLVDEVRTSGRVHDYHAWLRRKDGTPYLLSITMVPHPMAGEGVVLTILQDITGRLPTDGSPA